jgi:hypothetical protein
MNPNFAALPPRERRDYFFFLGAAFLAVFFAAFFVAFFID